MPTYRQMESWYQAEKAKRMQLEQDNAKLAQANVGLAQIVKTSEAACAEMAKRIDAAKRETGEAQKRIAGLEADLVRARDVQITDPQELKDAQKEIAAHKRVISKLSRQVTTLEQKLSEAEIKLADAEGRNARALLRGQMARGAVNGV